MGQNLLAGKHLNDEKAAYEYLSKMRWPDGPICVHCKSKKVYTLNVKASKRVVLKCGSCRKQFSATVGTVFEDSHIPLSKWIMACQLMCSAKKGISSHQLHRMLGITYKSAWFMSHRLRHAMQKAPGGNKLGGIVECDETYIGGKEKRSAGPSKKTAVFALVERNGNVRSFAMPRVTTRNLRSVIRENVSTDARIMTDEFLGYRGLKKEFADHQTINHSRGHYVRGEVTTNTIEGFFSLLKRGINGTFHHVSKHHLHRYLAEFDFRYNARKTDDATRALLAFNQIEGKRLMYK
ncbi:DDE transposase [Nitrospira sp. KM1]|uniref:IS1595 family transposase n=1 Tax=Nitrospira sp. KM1 TaxID=1936990 RepID=UPI0013A71CF1|nr:IS1595 family transposase [Nitrospira sp. KM1]BCA55821.1 DDE transposase [Nitrospira sp. KM1]